MTHTLVMQPKIIYKLPPPCHSSAQKAFQPFAYSLMLYEVNWCTGHIFVRIHQQNSHKVASECYH